MSWDQNELTRRELLKLGATGAGLLAFGPLLSACGSKSSGAQSSAPASSSGPKKGGTLVFGRSFQPTVQAAGLDPNNVVVSSGNVYTVDKIFEPLYATDPKGQLQPWLAKGSTISTDGLTVTYTLRDGVKFSDGKPLTADDVVFSLDRARLSKTGSLSFLDWAIKSIKAVDAQTVEVTLSQPYAPIISDISCWNNAIVPKDLGGVSEKSFFKNPIGTGPFVLKSWAQQGAEITLARNPNYWQAGKPYLDEVVFKVILDDNQRMLQVRSGEIQIADTVPPAQVADLKNDSSLVVSIFPAWSVDLLSFNEKIKHFADRSVRRAIAQTIDTKSIAQATTFGTSEPGGSFFPTSLQYYDASTPVLPFDIAAAKSELAKSGFPNGFSTEILIPSGNQVWAQTAQILQAGMQQIGITVKINQLDHAAYENDFRAFNYEMMINNAINDISDPDEMASFEVDAKNGGSDAWWTNYNSAEATKLVRQAAQEMDSTKRAALYKQIQAIVAQDAPFVALTYPPTICANTKKVNGFAVNPGGAYQLESVWLA
jgi:peptide/nickel transport system substrate-binding protein